MQLKNYHVILQKIRFNEVKDNLQKVNSQVNITEHTLYKYIL